VLQRSVIQSAADVNHQNKRLAFKTDLLEVINILDTKPSHITRNTHHIQKVRAHNNDVSNRTRSKVGQVILTKMMDIGLDPN
jgi:recombinational DNA repair ATPase RecF